MRLSFGKYKDLRFYEMSVIQNYLAGAAMPQLDSASPGMLEFLVDAANGAVRKREGRRHNARRDLCIYYLVSRQTRRGASLNKAFKIVGAKAHLSPKNIESIFNNVHTEYHKSTEINFCPPE